jgi:hypothetical protein
MRGSVTTTNAAKPRPAMASRFLDRFQLHGIQVSLTIAAMGLVYMGIRIFMRNEQKIPALCGNHKYNKDDCYQ